jgi:hypothetical protein
MVRLARVQAWVNIGRLHIGQRIFIRVCRGVGHVPCLASQLLLRVAMDFPLLVRLKSLGLLLREQLDTYDRACVAGLSFKRAFSPVVLILRSRIAQLRLIASTDLVSVFIFKHFGANCNVRVQVLHLFRVLWGAGRTFDLFALLIL